jgi:hypothetical protein
MSEDTLFEKISLGIIIVAFIAIAVVAIYAIFIRPAISGTSLAEERKRSLMTV